MLKAGECAPLFSNAATTYRMNRMWWERHRMTFQKWWEVIDDEYNPLWTNDSYHTVEEHKKADGSVATRTAGNSRTETDGKTANQTITAGIDNTVANSKNATHDGEITSKSKAETENGVSAYDSSSYSPHDISESRDSSTGENKGYSEAAGESETIHNTTTVGGVAEIGHGLTVDEGTSNTVTQDKANTEIVEHTYGNNSVLRTGQKLMESEIQVRQRLDLYNMMADIFCDEMLVWLYV